VLDDRLPSITSALSSYRSVERNGDLAENLQHVPEFMDLVQHFW